MVVWVLETLKKEFVFSARFWIKAAWDFRSVWLTPMNATSRTIRSIMPSTLNANKRNRLICVFSAVKSLVLAFYFLILCLFYAFEVAFRKKCGIVIYQLKCGTNNLLWSPFSGGCEKDERLHSCSLDGHYSRATYIATIKCFNFCIASRNSIQFAFYLSLQIINTFIRVEFSLEKRKIS